MDYLAPLAKHNAAGRSIIAGRRWLEAEPLKSPSANPESSRPAGSIKPGKIRFPGRFAV
jgi:hypothetical protein